MATDLQGLSAFVLGHRGMLGHVVARWLAERGARVVTSERREDGAGALLDEVLASRCDAVVNAVATTARGQMLATNGLWPQRLAAALGGSALLVHPSTDGVFSGARGPYPVSAIPDATDEYGVSKRLGELCAAVPGARVVVLRCSLVGPELGAQKSLLGWLGTQRGEVNGYLDRLWNGITTLEWARLCERAVRGELEPGLHQPACTEPVSKAQLLEEIAAAYGWHVRVRPVTSGTPVDRRLVPTLSLAPISPQLDALRRWQRSGG